MQQNHNSQPWDSRHFGTVVKDVDKTLEYYAKLGLGPFEVHERSFPARFKDRSITFGLKMGFSVGGYVQTEVIEPGENATVYTDTLTARGEGGQHVGFFVKDLGALASQMAKAGVEPIYQGKGETPEGAVEFAYFDTTRIGGVIFEGIQRTPPVEDAPRLGATLSQLRHVGVAVRDMDRTVEFYTALGFGPFSVREVALENLRRAGKSGLHVIRIKVAFSDNWLLPIELIEPLDDGTVYQETLEKKGEGIQHVACWVPDMAKEMGRLESLGIRPIMHNERFAYFETREVGDLIIELVQRQSA